MACRDCAKMQGQCEVCKLVDGDESFKEVFECARCGKVNICRKCENNWLKRGAAFVLKKFAKAKK